MLHPSLTLLGLRLAETQCSRSSPVPAYYAFRTAPNPCPTTLRSRTCLPEKRDRTLFSSRSIASTREVRPITAIWASSVWHKSKSEYRKVWGKGE
jgi:hypothetical protein